MKSIFSLSLVFLFVTSTSASLTELEDTTAIGDPRTAFLRHDSLEGEGDDSGDSQLQHLDEFDNSERKIQSNGQEGDFCLEDDDCDPILSCDKSLGIRGRVQSTFGRCKGVPGNSQVNSLALLEVGLGLRCEFDFNCFGTLLCLGMYACPSMAAFQNKISPYWF